jgi:hypothetical protein
MADPMDSVEHIYKVAEFPLTDDARRTIATYRNDHPRDKEGQVEYDLRADFGVEPEEVRSHFGFYHDVVGVREEVR